MTVTPIRMKAYCITKKGSNDRLDLNKTLQELGIMMQSILEGMFIMIGIMISEKKYSAYYMSSTKTLSTYCTSFY